MRAARVGRAMAGVMALGAGAGTGAVLGLWAGLAWWTHGVLPGGTGSMLTALGYGAAGALAGLLLGAGLGGVLLVLGAAVLRGRRPGGEVRGPQRDPERDRDPQQLAGPDRDQSRSS